MKIEEITKSSSLSVFKVKLDHHPFYIRDICRFHWISSHQVITNIDYFQVQI